MVLCRQCGTANEAGKTKCVKCNAELIAPHMKGKIACANHAQREATSRCSVCGTTLCDACVYNLDEKNYCERCAPEGAISQEHDEDYEAIPVLNSTEAERAGLGERIQAAVIDVFFVAVLSVIYAAVLAMFTGGMFYKTSYYWLQRPNVLHFWLYWPVLLAISLVYHTVTVGMSGQTVGKRVSGVIILEPDGRISNATEAFVRAVGQILSLIPFGLGYLWALWDPNHETWHEKLSHTASFRYVDTT